MFCWLPLVFVSTILVGLVYTAVQQSYRMGANDPQIQLAQDSATAIQNGTSLPFVSDMAQVNVAQSLSPFRIMYDEKGNVVESQGQLNGAVPKLPSGVISYTKTHGEDRFTWQPATGVRLATAIVPYGAGGKSGFVLVARSLTEVEKREDQLFWMCGLAYGVLLLGSFGLVFLLAKVLSKR